MNKKLFELAKENNTISKDKYKKFNITNGLRNSDGSNLIVGLTKIGSSIGYKKTNCGLKPIQGKLFYRGMEIKKIVKTLKKNKRFEKIVFLILFGKLPRRKELIFFFNDIVKFRRIPENFRREILSNIKGNDLMNVLSRNVLSLYNFDKNANDLSLNNLINQSIMLIARLPNILIYSYKFMKYKKNGKKFYFKKSNSNFSFAENFLYLLKGKKYNKFEVEVLDLMFLLHAEHGGGNNSTFTIRTVSSSGSDTYSAISAAMGSLKGNLHGGSCTKSREMMLEIQKNVKNWSNEVEIKKYLKKILAGKKFDKMKKLYGFGHPVYTLSDPRNVLLKKEAKKIARIKNREKEFNFYEKIEKLAPKVIYDVKGKRDISANVDFYSGFIYDCLGISKDLYLSLFAISRVVGWCAHRIEELLSSKIIIRPDYRDIVKN
jgi:citrate synthase